MLPRIVLFALQLLAAWYLVPAIKSALPALLTRPYDIFVYAVLYALVITVVGFVGSLILKDVRTPSAQTLVSSLVLALLLAGLTLVPAVTQASGGVVPALRANPHIYPLIGALAGYFARR